MEPSKEVQQQIAEKGQWQWQSNAWSKSEEPQWTSYPPEQNNLIENSYYGQQNDIDLGDYIVSIKHMLQKKKGETIAQRSIRRIGKEEDEEMEIRCDRYLETESPKTMNKVFGKLEDFIEFFSKRNDEALKFARLFADYEKSNNLDGLNKEIAPKLVVSLQKEWDKTYLNKPAKPEEKKPSAFQQKILKRIMELGEKLISFFKNDFQSFQEFFGCVLKAYTMNTFLYKNMNKYLRDESWEEIYDLLPYAFCLCKAFSNLKQNLNLDENQTAKNPACFQLYRGTALDEGALSVYDTKKIKYFSWYSVTSTAKELEVAKKFMMGSQNAKNPQFQVIFEINVPRIEKESDYSRFLDVQIYSDFPKEAEVILAPGSVFELEEVNKNLEEEITTIKLTLKTDIETLAHGGLIMPGALQKEMMNQREAKIMCLEGKELVENLQHIYGNRLVQELEFCLSRFNSKSLKAMMGILASLKQVSDLKFISCYYDGDKKKLKDILSNKVNLELKRLEIFDVGAFSEIIWQQILEHQSWNSLQVLDITIVGPGITTDEYLGQISSEVLCRMTKLKSLSLNLKRDNEITDEGISSLCSQGVGNLVELESLSLDVSNSLKITDKGVYDLSSKALKNLTQLKSLSLNFKCCEKITNEGVNYLCCEGLKNLEKLIYLKLLFGDCPQIDGKGLSYLSSQGLKYLPQLISLCLDFGRRCDHSFDKIKITDLNNLASQGLKNLTQLTSLDLDFTWCWINDQGMQSLCSQGLRHLQKLTSLNLNFTYCFNLTNQAIKSLCVEGIKHFNQLRTLSLIFWNCRITDEAIYDLWFQGLGTLISLKSLSLTFLQCKVTGEGLNSLRLLGRRFLSQLENVNLNFNSSPAKLDPVLMVSKGISGLEMSSKFAYMRELKSIPEREPFGIAFKPYQDKISEEKLFLENSITESNLDQPMSINWDFSEWEELPKEYLDKIESLSEQNLSGLKNLSLSFWFCHAFHKDEFNIVCQGLCQLNQLESLSLNFACRPSAVEDEQITYLCSKVLKNLLKLKTLDLNLSSCFLITGAGIEILCTQGLRYLNQLEHLSLDFAGFEFGDESIDILCSQGLKYLPKLASLDLDLHECPKITDGGINHLCAQGIRNLSQLTSLKLNFSKCPKVSEFTAINIHRLLHYFGFAPETNPKVSSTLFERTFHTS